MAEFAKGALAGWTGNAIDRITGEGAYAPVVTGSIFDKLHVKPTVNSARRGRNKAVPVPQILPQRKQRAVTPAEVPLQPHETVVGKCVKLLTRASLLSKLYVGSVAESVNADFAAAIGAEVRDPATWTIFRHDGPNHLGL